MKIPRLSWQRVRLNTQCCSDIQWWASFLASWNGIAFFPDSLQGGHTLVSDASGSWGCGAFVGESLEWFQLKWPDAWADMHIAAKELYPIVIGAAVWGSQWTGLQVLFLCDNQAVVSTLSSRAVRDPMLMHLIRSWRLTLSSTMRPATSQENVMRPQMPPREFSHPIPCCSPGAQGDPHPATVAAVRHFTVVDISNLERLARREPTNSQLGPVQHLATCIRTVSCRFFSD